MIARILTLVGLALASAPALAQQISSADAAELRVLDKLTGEVTDVTVDRDTPQTVGSLLLQLSDCRYPTANPSGDAYAGLVVTYRDDPTPAFQGWMIASAPALNAMDHPRYDVWVLRCQIS